MAKIKKISVTQYANIRGVSRQAILKRLYPIYKPMPNINKVDKIGETYVLYYVK